MGRIFTFNGVDKIIYIDAGEEVSDPRG